MDIVGNVLACNKYKPVANIHDDSSYLHIEMLQHVKPLTMSKCQMFSKFDIDV